VRATVIERDRLATGRPEKNEIATENLRLRSARSNSCANPATYHSLQINGVVRSAIERLATRAARMRLLEGRVMVA